MYYSSVLILLPHPEDGGCRFLQLVRIPSFVSLCVVPIITVGHARNKKELISFIKMMCPVQRNLMKCLEL
jgi:hypothetical protein